MDVFITSPGGVVGPGLTIELFTDFIGPHPTGTYWEVRIDLDAEPGRAVGVFRKPWSQNSQATFVPWGNPEESVTTNTFNAVAGQSVHVNTQLVEPTGVIDSGSVVATWEPVAGLGASITETARNSASTAQGAFTAEDRAQLQAVDTKTETLGNPLDLVVSSASGLIQTTLAKLFSRHMLDLLTLDELTDGETCEPVRVAIGIWYYGVIVRVTTISPELVPKTPDAEWYFNDLAVLRIFRGADLEYRRGIHTPTFMTEHPWAYGLSILNEVEILGAPPDLTVAVDWREGCCGQVFLQRFP